MIPPIAHPFVSLRSILPEDRDRLFLWRNSEKVYPFMLNDRKVTHEEHQQWFMGLAQSKNFYRIVCYKQRPVGFLVICREELPHSASFGMYIAEEQARRLGIGKALVGFVLEYAYNVMECRHVTSVVRKNNEAAIRLYSACGFSVAEERDDLLFLKKSKEEGAMAKENKPVEHYLRIIDEIEKVRSRNNVNWMDVLRLAFRHAPEEAKALVRKINSADSEISELLARLGE